MRVGFCLLRLPSFQRSLDRALEISPGNYEGNHEGNFSGATVT